MKNRKGFTLIELLVVIAIVALMMGLSVGFFGNTLRVQIKKESRHLAGAIRYAYNEAALRNIPYRLVFDVTEQQYWLEEGTEETSLSLEETEEEKKGEKKPEDSEEAPPPPPFSEPAEGLVKKVKLEGEVRIRDIFVSHQEEPVGEGRAYLYFFPNGMTEEAVIHLSNEDETVNYSVIVQPLTGKSKILPEYVEHEKALEK